MNIVAPCNETNLGLEERCPATSCKEIFEQSRTFRPSGRYWIRNTNGVVLPLECDMTRECCGAVGGWALIAYLNMLDNTHTCPEGWRYQSSYRRACGRDTTDVTGGQVSVKFSTHKIQYSQVCGKIIGYQYGTPDAFQSSSGRSNEISGNYIDGVSVTYGSPQKHIWSLVAAKGEFYTDTSVCSCTNTANYNQINTPSFVGNDYFCEAGTYTSSHSSGFSNSYYYYGDRLWDGGNCGFSSTCCYFNNPPWFCKQLSPTTDDIEVRVMADERYYYEDILIEHIEIYIR